MRLDYLINNKKISKYVDPGSTYLPEGLITESKIKSNEAEIPTSSVAILETVIEKSNYVKELSQKAIDGLVAIETMADFQSLNDMLKNSMFDPYTMIQDGKIKTTPIDLNRVKKLQLSVYRNSKDSRTPFLKTLYGLLQSAGVIQYLFDTTWRQVLSSPNINKAYKESYPVRFIMHRTESLLDDYIASIFEISNLAPARLSNDLLDSLAVWAADRISQSNAEDLSTGKRNDLLKSLSQLRSVRLVYENRLLEHYKTWEEVESTSPIIRHIPWKSLLNKILLIQGSLIAIRAADEVADFFDEIRSYAGGSRDVQPIESMEEEAVRSIHSSLLKLENLLVDSEIVKQESAQNMQQQIQNAKGRAVFIRYNSILSYLENSLVKTDATVTPESLVMEMEKVV
jgi:hypothetical protein